MGRREGGGGGRGLSSDTETILRRSTGRRKVHLTHEQEILEYILKYSFKNPYNIPNEIPRVGLEEVFKSKNET